MLAIEPHTLPTAHTDDKKAQTTLVLATDLTPSLHATLAVAAAGEGLTLIDEGAGSDAALPRIACVNVALSDWDRTEPPTPAPHSVRRIRVHLRLDDGTDRALDTDVFFRGADDSGGMAEPVLPETTTATWTPVRTIAARMAETATGGRPATPSETDAALRRLLDHPVLSAGARSELMRPHVEEIRKLMTTARLTITTGKRAMCVAHA